MRRSGDVEEGQSKLEGERWRWEPRTTYTLFLVGVFFFSPFFSTQRVSQCPELCLGMPDDPITDSCGRVSLSAKDKKSDPLSAENAGTILTATWTESN